MYPSSLLQYFADIDRVGPLDAQSTIISFPGAVSAGGAVTTPATQQVPSGFYFLMREIRAWGNFVAGNFGLAATLTFQVRGDATKRNAFETAIEFSSIIDPVGGMNPIQFGVGYRFSPSEVIRVTLTRTDAGAIAQAVTCGISLVGDLISVGSGVKNQPSLK